MSRTWLIIDSDYLCHRAMHTYGELSFQGARTGVVFGYLRHVQDLQEQFQASGVVHCFNHGRNLRLDLFPDYKRKRKEKQKDVTPEEKAAWKEFDKQRSLLRSRYLLELGYRNVCFQKGYESDDVMAAVVVPESDEGVLITSDNDLLQCIQPNVLFHNPSRAQTITLQSHTAETGLDPRDYWKVLVLAGCSTDEVPGIAGVGKTTAIKYLTGNLPTRYKVHTTIKREFGRVLKQNKPLVKLPMKGCEPVHPQPDDLCNDAWNALCKELGMKSLRKKNGKGKRKFF